jgi:hypothetical protein
MITKKHTALVALAVCTLALAAVGRGNNPIARPFEITGQTTWAFDMSTGKWEASDSGVATHVGKYSNHGSGSGGTLQSGLFTLTAANGDQIFAVVLNADATSIGFNKGTGRFQECSGGFKSTSSTLVSEKSVGNVYYATYKYTGTGTITY